MLKSKHFDRLSLVRGLRPRKGRGIDIEGDLVLPLPFLLFDFLYKVHLGLVEDVQDLCLDELLR